MEIDRDEVRRLLQLGVLEFRTINNDIREIIAREGVEGLVSLSDGRYGINLNGQAPDWVCPQCGAKKFCPTLQLPFYFEVECDAGVLVCGACQYSQVVPVRLGCWVGFSEIKKLKL